MKREAGRQAVRQSVDVDFDSNKIRTDLVVDVETLLSLQDFKRQRFDESIYFFSRPRFDCTPLQSRIFNSFGRQMNKFVESQKFLFRIQPIMMI